MRPDVSRSPGQKYSHLELRTFLRLNCELSGFGQRAPLGTADAQGLGGAALSALR